MPNLVAESPGVNVRNRGDHGLGIARSAFYVIILQVRSIRVIRIDRLSSKTPRKMDLGNIMAPKRVVDDPLLLMLIAGSDGED